MLKQRPKNHRTTQLESTTEFVRRPFWQMLSLIFVVVVLFFVGVSAFLAIVIPAKTEQALEITVANLHNRASFGNEVWVDGFYRADGTQISPAEFSLQGTAEVRGTMVVLNGATGKLQWKGKLYKNAWLVLSGHQWSGVATISWNGTHQTVDLFDATGKRQFVLLQAQAQQNSQSVTTLSEPFASIVRAITGAVTFILFISLILYFFRKKQVVRNIVQNFTINRGFYQLIFVVFIVFILPFILRLYAIRTLNINDIMLGWDAKDYWTRAQGVRSAFCHSILFCNADTAQPSSIETIIIDLTGRPGLMPLISGVTLGLFPNQSTTIHLVFAFFDAIVCVLVFDFLRTLKAPLWVAFLGAVIQATYIPSVIGTVTFLQQPVIRLCVTLVIWAYARAFSSERHLVRWILIGGGATLLLGFSVLTLRPVMWLIFGTVCLCLAIFKATRQWLRWHLLVIFAAGALLCLAAGLFSVFIPGQSWLIGFTTGWSNQAASIATTPVSFPYFWPPNDYTNVLTVSRSLSDQLKLMPIEFVDWLLFSIFANWYYPDYLYFQQFILTIDQQKTQHLTLLILAITGLMWLIGQRGARQQSAVLLIVVVASMSLIYGVVSVEPRRLSALSSIIAISGASCFWGIAHLGLAQQQMRLRLGVAFACIGAVWLLPFPIVMNLFSVSPSIVYRTLIVVRVVSTGLAGLWLLRWWSRTTQNYVFWLPSIAFIGVLMFVGYNVQRLDWRAWETLIDTPVQQRITGVRQQAHLWPWLIVDVGDQQQARELEIEIDGKVIKPAGVPMAQWVAKPNSFHPIKDLESVSNAGIKARTWFAVPIDKALLSGDTMMVEIHPPATGLLLRGDYIDSPQGIYVGPLRDPWKTEQSLWRWQWNATDPRIYWTQSFENKVYESNLIDGSPTVSGDLSPEFGLQSGLFRVFLIEESFGPYNNVVPNGSYDLVEPFAAYLDCSSPGDRLIAEGEDKPYICHNADHSVSYFTAAGQKIGTSKPEVFEQNKTRNSLVEMVTNASSQVVRVEILQVYDTGFVANFYGDVDHLLYSLAFEYKNDATDGS